MGQSWWLDTNEELRSIILEAIRKLPLAIEIETERGLVGFVHADVPMDLSWCEFKKRLEGNDSRTREVALWGRSRIHSDNQDGVEGVGRVFVGHTPQWSGIKRYGNVYAVDTGAVYRDMGLKEIGHLSMLNIVAKTECLTEQKINYDLVNVLDDKVWSENMDVEKRPRFGHYTRASS